uniref:PWWP domain-containing protein n=1 Tax=Salix viminalis TaxID=40686 RepID=A0A6N2MQ50_SALVM
MGCSSGDPNCNINNINTKAIDASVGALVWVRRRNGSWWPGRIVGLDEVSEGSLVSPVHPVKLLGARMPLNRFMVSISIVYCDTYLVKQESLRDWYNLEKSKRVKAFRCGEYDECIEKAKTSAANGNKRAVKYARREDPTRLRD